MARHRRVLADPDDVTHWYVGALLPSSTRTGKPQCNYGRGDGVVVITKVFATELPWPTCLRCAVGP